MRKQSGVFLLTSLFSFNKENETKNSVISKAKGKLKEEFSDTCFYISGEDKENILKELDLYNINEAKASVIEKYFEEIVGRNFWGYITDCRIEKVFENDNEVVLEITTQLSDILTRVVSIFLCPKSCCNCSIGIPLSIAIVASVRLNLCGCTLLSPNCFPNSLRRTSTPPIFNLSCGDFNETNSAGLLSFLLSK